MLRRRLGGPTANWLRTASSPLPQAYRDNERVPKWRPTRVPPRLVIVCLGEKKVFFRVCPAATRDSNSWRPSWRHDTPPPPPPLPRPCLFPASLSSAPPSPPLAAPSPLFPAPSLPCLQPSAFIMLRICVRMSSRRCISSAGKSGVTLRMQGAFSALPGIPCAS
jgi:hypothetical protein